MDQGGDDVLEDEPVGDAPTMAAQRMARVEGGPFRQVRGEFVPYRLQQG